MKQIRGVLQLLLITGAAALGFWNVAYAEPGDLLSADAISDLSSKDWAKQEEAEETLSKEHAGVVEHLIKSLQNEHTRPRALHLLSKYRSPRAARYILASAIEKDNSGISVRVLGGLPTPEEQYPVITHLTNIGLPAVKVMFENCKRGNVTEEHLAVYAWVIRKVDGEEVGRYRIEMELKAARKPIHRGNLQNLLKMYDGKGSFFRRFKLIENSQTSKPSEDTSSTTKSADAQEKHETRRETQISKPISREKPEAERQTGKESHVSEPREEAAEVSEPWIVQGLTIAVVVLAGLVVFLLLRRKRS